MRSVTPSLPEAYVAVQRESVHAFALDTAAAWLGSVLNGGTTLHGWAGERAGARAFAGRGTVWSVAAPAPGPDRRERWAVRHYIRGGAVASYLVDRYLSSGAPRPWIELAASVGARSRGVPTPAVVAGAVYPTGVFYRADLVTEVVPGARDLSDAVFGPDPDPDPGGLLHAVGRLVRRMGEARVRHADLNAKNLLVVGGGSSAALHVIDLDMGAALPMQGAPTGEPMLLRMERSLRKLERVSGRAIDGTAQGQLRAGWMAGR